MSCEFTCEGCGADVFSAGMDHPPADGFCALCHALHWPEYQRLPPAEWWATYRHMNHGRTRGHHADDVQ